MNPTQKNTPSGAPDNSTAPLKSQLDAAVSTTGPNYKEYKQKANDDIQAVLDSGKQTLEEGRKWLDGTVLADKTKELPQKAKDLGSQALTKFNDLTTTQKAVGMGLLAAGVAFLVIRSKKHKDDGEYRLRPRRSPFAKKSHKEDDGKGSPRAQQRPWGSSRYGSSATPASADKDRVTAGSGPQPGYPDPGQRPTPPTPGQRRDQGPAVGSRYDAKASGNQNPNNLDQLNSAF